VEKSKLMGMKLSVLVERLKNILEEGDIEIARIFRNDFGDELVLEGPYPNHKRVYLVWDLDDD
jgi:hypothetical protein